MQKKKKKQKSFILLYLFVTLNVIIVFIYIFVRILKHVLGNKDIYKELQFRDIKQKEKYYVLLFFLSIIILKWIYIESKRY